MFRSVGVQKIFYQRDEVWDRGAITAIPKLIRHGSADLNEYKYVWNCHETNISISYNICKVIMESSSLFYIPPLSLFTTTLDNSITLLLSE